MFKVLDKLERSFDFWFLFVTGILFFLFRLPSLFEPLWYGDEGIYEVVGFGLRHGRLLYQGIWDNKPPLLYLIYAIFSGDQPQIKFLSLVVGLVSIVVFFLLAKKIFSAKLAVYISTAVFAFFLAIPLVEGNIANAENFMLLPTTLAALIVVSVLKKNKLLTTYYLLLTSGLLLGLSFLTKVVAVFDFGALMCLIAIYLNQEKIYLKQTLNTILFFGLGFIIPVTFTVMFFLVNHAFSIFLNAVLFSNISYVAYGNNQVLPHFYSYIKLILLGLSVAVIFLKRKSLTLSEILIYLWVSFSIYNCLFSQRPYTHYLLVLLPSLSLLVGSLFVSSKLKSVSIIFLLFTLLIVYKNFTLYNKNISYYANFISYVLGQKDTTSYQTFFDRVTPRDYLLSAYINTHKKPGLSLLVWGNSGQIYKLTNSLPPGRFIVAYHVILSPQNQVETEKVLKDNPPTFVIILPNQPNMPYSLKNYEEKFILDNAVVYEKLL